MKSIAIIVSAIKKVTILSMAMVVMVSCSEEALVEKPAQVEEVPALEIIEEADVASVTISGIFTEVSEDIDCATCTFKVPDNVRTVDGAALGLKPGSVVCINNGRKLGEVEFVNMTGTEDAPIVIGSCDE